VWLAEKRAKQAELDKTDMPVLKSSALVSKAGKLNREIKYLARRPPPRKRKPKVRERHTGLWPSHTWGGGPRNGGAHLSLSLSHFPGA
jgi:hypothetical protein